MVLHMSVSLLEQKLAPGRSYKFLDLLLSGRLCLLLYLLIGLGALLVLMVVIICLLLGRRKSSTNFNKMGVNHEPIQLEQVGHGQLL